MPERMASPLSTTAHSNSASDYCPPLLCVKLLVAIASYGTSSDHHLRALLAHLHLFGERAASWLRMDVVVDRTHTLPGANATVRIWPHSVGFELTGKHRVLFAAAMGSHSHDWFLYTEDDLMLTPSLLLLLLRENAAVAERALIVLPRRYELNNGKRLLTDSTYSAFSRRLNATLLSGPVAKGVVEIQNRTYLLAMSGYAGMYLLSRRKMLAATAEYRSQTSHNWSAPHSLGPHKTLRERNAGLWLTRRPGAGLQVAYPVDRLEDLLVHHASDRYARINSPPREEGIPPGDLALISAEHFGAAVDCALTHRRGSCSFPLQPREGADVGGSCKQMCHAPTRQQL